MDGFGDSFVPPAEGAFVPPAEGAAVPPTESAFVPPVEDGFVAPAEGAVPPAVDDPAAEFLAREQDQLAGLDDDIIPPATDAPAVETEASTGLDADDLFGGNLAAPAVNGFGGSDLESFEMIGGGEVAPDQSAPPPVFGSEDPQPAGGEDLFAPAPPLLTKDEGFPPTAEEVLGDLDTEPLSSAPGGLAASDLQGSTVPEVDYSSFGGDFGGATEMSGEAAAPEPVSAPEPARSPVPHVMREEPEKIKLWREGQRVRLEEKDAAENENKEELKKKAKQELEDWYKQHEEQVAKTRQANRSAEKELVAETTKMEPGTEWERITKLCDFNPKTAKSSRDISRMRSIILQVKQNPPIKA